MQDTTPEEKRQFTVIQAKKEKAELEAMKAIIKADNDCIAKLIIDQKFAHAFSKSDLFLTAINKELKELQKAIDGEENNWE